ncbi:YicC family protein [Myroides sp. 1354]|uniref:YicC/YloC family endoribonuclease n=1 Tax=unclassified Myroides TaxID=2642485 RepID=UPI00257760B6|nr:MULTISPECIES: YicC/YloC family endoribonuclease [unclassified Myroides]MDM1043584.1 YicC family protein [Myroides sp. R163-1]MDM1054366.1 YicC family protein [Myroides sp. 1354]MDM1067662.1 YicC family protein [Myroides sp. 1372]
MTGFGKACLQLPTKKITIEVKSLNSKNLDLNVRLPLSYREKELALRNQIALELERGKVDFSLFCEITAEETSSKINAPIVLAYIEQMKAIIPNADATELMKMAVRMPDALKVERNDFDEAEWKEIEVVIQEAIQNMKAFRVSEGKSLENDFRARIANIFSYMDQVSLLDKDRIVSVKERLRANLTELQLTIDENRFEQEVIYYLEKLDITEEKVRLSKHLEYFLETLGGTEANGRKLGFIAQEMGREINTMGSKSNHAEMQKIVVKMKDELEKIKEQVLNVL